MRRKVRPLLAAALAAALLAAFPAAAGTWHEEQSIEHDGLTRWFRVYEPDVPPPPEGYPLLFVLHGGGGGMRSFLDNGTHAEWPEIADEEGILLVVPNGVNPETGDTAGDDQNWNDCRADAPAVETGADDVGFVSALIDRVAARWPVDLRRVYATGSSNGGLMSWRLAFELGDRIAAVAPFIANLAAVSECRDGGRVVPVFICNGDAEERYMPWEGGCIYDQENCTRGRVISAEATRDFFVRRLHADPEPTESVDHPDLDPDDGCTVHHDLYAGGFEGAEVAFYRVRGGGHTTPSIDHRRNPWVLQLLGLGRQSHDVEGSREAWAFLSRHVLDGTAPAGPPGVSGLLRVEKAGEDALFLRWAGDCGGGDRYGVYRGDLAAGWNSAAPVPGRCGVSSRSLEVPVGDGTAEFFVVVPATEEGEGSFGRDSEGSDRPAPPVTCAPPAPALASCALR